MVDRLGVSPGARSSLVVLATGQESCGWRLAFVLLSVSGGINPCGFANFASLFDQSWLL